MLQVMCDLCGAKIGNLTDADARNKEQMKVTKGSRNMFIGDVCDACYKRFCDLLNLPKTDY